MDVPGTFWWEKPHQLQPSSVWNFTAVIPGSVLLLFSMSHSLPKPSLFSPLQAVTASSGLSCAIGCCSLCSEAVASPCALFYLNILFFPSFLWNWECQPNLSWFLLTFPTIAGFFFQAWRYNTAAPFSGVFPFLLIPSAVLLLHVILWYPRVF